VIIGYAFAIAIDDHPVPHAISATRAGGAARKRESMSGIVGSQVVPR
jgi:hypothetical protein